MVKKDDERAIPKDVLRAFIKENNLKTAEDVQHALRDIFSGALQEMLEAEMDQNLGYEKHDDSNKQAENRRNGHSKKTVRSEYGDITLDVPRDRDGEFKPLIIKKHQKSVAGVEEQILLLYAKGVSTREIQDHLQRLYVSKYHHFNIECNKQDYAAQSRNGRTGHYQTSTPLFLWMPSISMFARTARSKKAAYMSVGIDLEGRKDVLGIWIGEHESAKFWLSVLNELKNRGVQDILIICVDNLTGFSEAIAACYPQSEVQKCIVCQIRNSIRYVSYKDVKKIVASLKPIYTAPTENATMEELNLFETA